MTEKKSGTAQRSGIGIGVVLVALVLFFLMRTLGGGSSDGNSGDETSATAVESTAPMEDVDSEEGESASPEGQDANDETDTSSTQAEEPQAASQSSAAEESASGNASDPEVDAFEAAVAESAERAPDGMPLIMLDELPPEAIETLVLIAEDGPFPYSKDGSTFQNREGYLPDEPQGYYAEYTVETPGSPDRGARRIVAGDGAEYYYTDDHYNSFSWIVLVEPTSAGGEPTQESESDSEEMSEFEAAVAESASRAPDGMPLIMLNELPPEAIDTLILIAEDGPFPYSKDGSTFQNREGYLPDEPQGYYAEYTVETPGSPDRGARRIVAGDGAEYYYTDDHYNSFSWIVLVE